jgi:hypothetical protein
MSPKYHAAAARRQDVRRKYLERRIARLDRFHELAGELGRRVRVQHDMIGPIARTLADKILVARFDGLHRGQAVAPISEIDIGGRAAEQRSASHLLGSGGDERRAVRLYPHMVQVHVRVDAARHDDMSVRVNDTFGGFGRKRADSGDRGDGLADNRDIAADDPPRRHHVAAANDEIKHHASCRRGDPSASLTQALIHAVLVVIDAGNESTRLEAFGKPNEPSP